MVTKKRAAVNAKRDYKKEYARDHASPTQKKQRAQRNSARSTMEKDGKVRKGDGKDVDHKKRIAKGGTNAKANLKVASKKKNRGWRDGKKGYDR